MPVFKRPIAIYLGSLGLLLSPLFNYLSFSLLDPMMRSSLLHGLLSTHLAALGFMMAAPVLGFGLWKIRKWAWYGLMIYTGLLWVYNAYALILFPHIQNLGVLVTSILLLSIALYFLRRDIAAPYLKMYPRGWRLQKRSPIVVPVTVDHYVTRTRDISESGAYLDWPANEKEIGQLLSANFSGFGQLNVKCVRKDPDGIGLLFKPADRWERKRIREWVRSLESKS